MSEPMDMREDRFTSGDEREVETRTQRIIAFLSSTSQIHKDFVRNELLDLMDHSSVAANREQKAELSAALAEHGKTLLALNKAAFETIPNLEAELSTLRASVGEKWIEIKEGCEMPLEDGTFVSVCRRGGHYSYAPTSARFGTYHPNAKGKETWRDASGVKIDFTHWQPLPAPPTLPTEEK